MSSALLTYPIQAHFESDSCVLTTFFFLSGVCVNVTKVEMWMTLGVVKDKTANIGTFVSAYLFLSR